MRVVRLYTLFSILLIAAVSCNPDDDDIINSAPTAEAGPNQTITLPVSTATLTGAGTDSDGQIKSYMWTQLSGPAASVITNPGTASTPIKFSTAGTYVFQLMVTDNMHALGYDTTRVIVNPAVQQTVTFQPANNPWDWGLALRNGVDAPGPSATDIPIISWTLGGNPLLVRSIFKFDLSGIPQGATIVSANLYLYSHPTPTPNGNFVDANTGSNNSFVVQRVTTDWATATVNWSNFSTTSQNEVVVPHTTSKFLDLNLNVTNMVAVMVNNNTNYGFFMKLQDESLHNGRIFVSSKNTLYPDKRPKLVVVYQ